jgi:hypothetical protein
MVFATEQSVARELGDVAGIHCVDFEGIKAKIEKTG